MIVTLLKKLFDSQDAGVEAHIVLAVVSVLVFLGLSIYTVVFAGAPFDPAAWGQGLGLTFAGAGAAAWGQGLQRKTEKKED